MNNRISTLAWQLPAVMVALACLILTSSFGQDRESIEKGVIRIKVTDSFAAQLQTARFSRSSDNVLITGIQLLDNLNRRFKVHEIRRVFKPAGKFEARHRKYGLHLWYEIELDKNITVLDAISSYRGLPQIQKVEPMYKKKIVGSDTKNFAPVIAKPEEIKRATLPGTSNDPMLGQQWHYHNTGQTSGTAGSDIKLLGAWTIETGSNNVIVAVTDGGIQSDHPDLAANMWVNAGEIPGNGTDDDNNGYIDDIHGYSFVDQSPEITPNDHGTHVGGTIAAVSNNGVGVAGVAGGSGSGDGVRLMSCAVFNGWGDGFAEAYVYSADNGAVISQNSWGYIYPGVYEQSVLDGIDYFIAEAGTDEFGNQTGPMKGGLVIFASGNSSSSSNFFPGYYAPTLAVASTNHNDQRAYYSNYGTWVDISAPGGEIIDAQETGVLSTLSMGQYGYFDGTSMACPHVSGVAALLLSKYGGPGMTPSLLRGQLVNTADDIYSSNPGMIGKLGAGRLNAHKALQPDNTVPDQINDLAVLKVKVISITLRWTAPHDGDNRFTAAYDLRYSTQPINDANFDSATPVQGTIPSVPPDSTITFEVLDLTPATQYYFAIKALDFGGNESPLSNVVSASTNAAPSLQVTPDSLVEHLYTAQTSVRNLTIANTGEGPLEFSFQEQASDFVSVSVQSGVVEAGEEIDVQVTFDAHSKLAGNYEDELAMDVNDPEVFTFTIPVQMIVANNGAPIASVSPMSLNFKAVQVGDSITKSITVRNDGSDTLRLVSVQSDHPAFSTNFSTPTNIAPFEEYAVAVTFAPQTNELFSAQLKLLTNIPGDSMLYVALSGEGMTEHPVDASPDSITVSIEKGSSVIRTLTLTNNGSEGRDYQINIKTIGRIVPPQPVNPWPQEEWELSRKNANTDAVAFNKNARKEKASTEVNALLQPLRKRNENVAARVRPMGTETGYHYYFTDFEDFNYGQISGQGGWDAFEDYVISDENPDSGIKHFSAQSSGNGTFTYAISPVVVDIWSEEEWATIMTTTMRVNMDHASGTTYEIIPEGGFVVTRLRFNGDGTIEALTGGYDAIWAPVDVPVPSGYFDLAIMYNGGGNDTTGFALFDIFFNNQKVFSGYGIGMAIGDVAFTSNNAQAGSSMLIEDLKVYEGEFTPQCIFPSPLAGTIPAGQSIDVDLEFNTEFLDFGTYKSEVVVNLEEPAKVTVPTKMMVTGDPDIFIQGRYPWWFSVSYDYPDTVKGWTIIYNRGGAPLNFEIEDNVPWADFIPASGSIEPRGAMALKIPINVQGMMPGKYIDSVKITSNDPVDPVFYQRIELTVRAAILRAEPNSFTVDLTQGEKTKQNLKIFNDGNETLYFQFEYLPPWVSKNPNDRVSYPLPPGGNGSGYTFEMAFDATYLEPGIYHDTIRISSNHAFGQIFPIPVQLTVKEKPQQITSFSLIRVSTGEVIAEFTDGITLNLQYQSLQDLTVRANPVPVLVGSVKFRINGSQTNIDNYSPYMMKKGIVPSFTAGQYTLYAEPWTGFGGKGKRGIGLQAIIKIIDTSAQSISHFTLVNSWTGEVVKNFDEHLVMDVSDPNWYSYQLYANAIPDTVGSVKFRINNMYQLNIDNDVPYKLRSYALQTNRTGTVTFSAVPYTEEKGHGIRGLENFFTVTYIDSKARGAATARENFVENAVQDEFLNGDEKTFSVYPVPVTDELTIQFTEKVEGDVELTIMNVHGQVLYAVPVTVQQLLDYRISTNEIGLSTGAYYLMLRNTNLRKSRKFMKQ